MILARAVKSLIRRRPKRIGESDHCIRKSQIESAAAAAVQRLQDAGFETYIVGGAVRDLLLGIAPKDFDISTSATPKEIRKLFRRSRIIGRRFQIVHLYRNRGWRDYIEVTTFRADGEAVARNASGRIINDNMFGSAAEDAIRRDFTCNALFYNPADGEIIDYAGGASDIRRRKLVVIGGPSVRFRQDPVRMLRALRMECRLGLSPDRATVRALKENAALLADIAPSRLFDEASKIINSGAAAAIFHRCAEFGMSQYALPASAEDEFAKAILKSTDERRAADKEISLSFVAAGLFWTRLSERWHALQKEGAPPVRAMEQAISGAEFWQGKITPRRIIARAVDLFFLQARFESSRRGVRRASGVLRHPLFARAIAFAEMRTDSGGKESAKWWREYQTASAAVRKKMAAKKE